MLSVEVKRLTSPTAGANFTRTVHVPPFATAVVQLFVVTAKSVELLSETVPGVMVEPLLLVKVKVTGLSALLPLPDTVKSNVYVAGKNVILLSRNWNAPRLLVLVVPTMSTLYGELRAVHAEVSKASAKLLVLGATNGVPVATFCTPVPVSCTVVTEKYEL